MTGQAWRIEVPPATGFITANYRGHWGPKAQTTANLRAVVKQLALDAKLPTLNRINVLVEYESPPRRKQDRHPLASPRVEDHDNLAPAAKTIVDALVDAHVVAGDSRKRATSRCRIRPVTHPKGRLLVVVADAAAPPGCDASLLGAVPTNNVLTGECRCLVCARCGRHTGNNTQGHSWKACKVLARQIAASLAPGQTLTAAQWLTRASRKEFHFCCTDPAYGCEYEFDVKEVTNGNRN